jgi:hypothetical protein
MTAVGGGPVWDAERLQTDISHKAPENDSARFSLQGMGKGMENSFRASGNDWLREDASVGGQATMRGR